MMRKIVILLSCLFTLGGFGQMISKFLVTEATYNKKDETKMIRSQNVCTVFYVASDKSPCMANMWLNNQSQSFGRIYDVKKKRSLNKSKTVYTFKWTYENSYNDKTGMAKVTFIEIHGRKRVDFTMKMALENGDVFCYKGQQTPFKL